MSRKERHLDSVLRNLNHFLPLVCLREQYDECFSCYIVNFFFSFSYVEVMIQLSLLSMFLPFLYLMILSIPFLCVWFLAGFFRNCLILYHDLFCLSECVIEAFDLKSNLRLSPFWLSGCPQFISTRIRSHSLAWSIPLWTLVNVELETFAWWRGFWLTLGWMAFNFSLHDLLHLCRYSSKHLLLLAFCFHGNREWSGCILSLYFDACFDCVVPLCLNSKQIVQI